MGKLQNNKITEVVLYEKCARSKDNPYGLKQVSDEFTFDKPTLITVLPLISHRKEINGAIIKTGEAIGFIRDDENMSPLVDYYSWQDIEQTNYRLLSIGPSDNLMIDKFYNKYLLPYLFIKNEAGEKIFKDKNTLAHDLRKINFCVLCNATKYMNKLSILLENSLCENGNFSSEDIDFILKQICVIDVTTRLDYGSLKFTNIHLFSQSDDDLMYPKIIRESSPGIHMLTNKEASIIIKQLMKQEMSDHDHAFGNFFNLKGGKEKTNQGQIMAVITNILLSNVLSHSAQDKTLNKNPLNEISFIFDKQVKEFFNTLLTKEDISKEEIDEALKLINKSRILPMHFVKSKEKIRIEKAKRNNLLKYLEIIDFITVKSLALAQYLDEYKMFRNSKGFKNFEEENPIAKNIFDVFDDYCKRKIDKLTKVLKITEKINYQETNDYILPQLKIILNQVKNPSKIEKLYLRDSLLELSVLYNTDSSSFGNYNTIDDGKEFYQKKFKQVKQNAEFLTQNSEGRLG